MQLMDNLQEGKIVLSLPLIINIIELINTTMTNNNNNSNKYYYD